MARAAVLHRANLLPISVSAMPRSPNASKIQALRGGNRRDRSNSPKRGNSNHSNQQQQRRLNQQKRQQEQEQVKQQEQERKRAEAARRKEQAREQERRSRDQEQERQKKERERQKQEQESKRREQQDREQEENARREQEVRRQNAAQAAEEEAAKAAAVEQEATKAAKMEAEAKKLQEQQQPLVCSNCCHQNPADATECEECDAELGAGIQESGPQGDALPPGGASAAVGRRIAVLWDEGEWYEGQVSSVHSGDAGVKVLHVVYDDGDEEEVTLGQDKVKFL